MLKNMVSELLSKWVIAENKGKMYGFEGPQAKAARDELSHTFREILPGIKKVSLVRKDDDIEILGENWSMIGTALQPKPLIEVIRSTFENLKINSITFDLGLSPQELQDLFAALNMSFEELTKVNGLGEFLKTQQVHHIHVDQMHFKLLKDGESVQPVDTQELVNKFFEDKGLSSQDDKKLAQMNKEEFSFAWKNFLEGGVSKETFLSYYDNLIQLVRKEPSRLSDILRNIVGKEKDMDSFIAEIEQKLSELGFRGDEIQVIKDTLREPKKVLIAEEELVRLKKIEGEFQRSVEERIENTLKEVRSVNKKLTRERERIDAMLRQSSQGVIVINKDGKILSLNSLAERVLGLSVKEGQEKSLSDIISGDRFLSLTKKWQDETDEFTPGEVEVISGDADVRDIIAGSSAIVENEDGKAIGMVSSLQDVVEKEALSKRRNEILDVLSHDLKAPIFAAKQGLLVVMKGEGFMDSLDEQQKEMLSICQRNIEKMAKLVNTIMDARQLEMGKIILRREETDIRKLLEESVNSLKTWAQDKAIQLKTSIEEIPPITIDAERVYEVIVNLLSNAFKFTPQGGVVEVRAYKEGAEPHCLVKISVADSGIGIKEDDLERIFKKYEQVSLKSPKGGSGLGLGLAICKSIVELHGGKIWVESKEGKGSTFIFTLPFNVSQSDPE